MAEQHPATDIVSQHERALDQAACIVDGVQPDQLDLPTPCTDWSVRALLGHLVGGNWRFVAVAEGQPVQRGSAADDRLGDDPAAAYHTSAEALRRAWRQPGRLEGMYDLPFGRLPGQAALGMHLVETVTHSWDLARATGQEPAFDPDIVETALGLARRSLPADRPPGTPFGPEVPIAADAPAIDRLAAFLGRRG